MPYITSDRSYPRWREPPPLPIYRPSRLAQLMRYLNDKYPNPDSEARTFRDPEPKYLPSPEEIAEGANLALLARLREKREHGKRFWSPSARLSGQVVPSQKFKPYRDRVYIYQGCYPDLIDQPVWWEQITST